MSGASKLTAHRSSLTAAKSYRAFGILCEPYFDIDFNEVFYLTDTGRRWDGKFAVRDRVEHQFSPLNSQRSSLNKYRTTDDVINALRTGTFPQKVMMTFHPQRWHDRLLPWVRELVWQNAKNQVKRIVVRRRSRE